MTFKTLAYIVIALLVGFGLLKAAWNISGNVMQQSTPATQTPVVEPKVQPENKPVQADPAGGADTNGSAEEKVPEPAKPRDKKSADDGYYDDETTSTPGAVKQHRDDKKDPYKPDEREVEKEKEPVLLPDNDREEDRTAEPESNPIPVLPDVVDDR